MNKLFAGMYLLLLIVTLFAREKEIPLGNIRGRIVDNETEKPIKNVVVLIISLALVDTTDEEGVFSFIDLTPGRYDFEISRLGYEQSYQPSIQIKTGINQTMVFNMQRAVLQDLDKVVVSSSKMEMKRAEQTTSVIKLTRAEIKNSPGAFEDVNEVIKILPSAVGTQYDWDNSLLVRGGSDNENVYLIDGMEVSSISHWGTNSGTGGAISGFHPDFIDHVDFYAGGFPAAAPPRLSSISVMKLREGSYQDHHFQTDMNMAGVGAFIEGPIVPEKVSFMLNGRVSFLDLIRKMINTGGLPRYQNGQLKLSYRVNENNKLYLNILGMHDEIGDTVNDEEDPYSYRDENHRLVGGIGWNFLTNKYKSNLVFSGTYTKGEDFNFNGFDQIVTFNMTSTRKKFHLRNHTTVYLREHDILGFGADAQYQDYNEAFSHDGFISYIDTAGIYRITRKTPDLGVVSFNQNSQKYNMDTINVLQKDTSLVGIRAGGYLHYSLNVNSLKINAGLRNDYFTILKEHGFSPRLSARLNLDNIGAFAISSGLYYQFPTYLQVLSMKGYLDKIKLQRNWQVACGYEKQIRKAIVTGTEIYYKYYDREPLYELQDQKRKIDTTFDTYGKKRAYGIEFYIQKKKRDKFYYNISYTLLNSEQQYKDKKWHNDDYNLRNSATIVIGSQFHRYHGVCLRLDFSEGYPYTPIDIEGSDIDTRYILVDGWNSKRHKFRAKIGFRYDLTWYLPKANVTLYCEVKNLLNQRDVLGQFYNPTKKKISQYEGMGILPVGGLTIDF